MISILLDIMPVAKGRPRFTGAGHAYTPEKTRKFEATVAMLMRKAFTGMPLEGAVKVIVTFVMPKPKRCKRVYPTTKPDTENMCKAVFDAANGILWKDDSQIVRIEAWKVYGECPHITLAFGEIT